MLLTTPDLIHNCFPQVLRLSDGFVSLDCLSNRSLVWSTSDMSFTAKDTQDCQSPIVHHPKLIIQSSAQSSTNF